MWYNRLMKTTGNNKKAAKDIIKNAGAGILGYLGAIGIIVAPLLIIGIIVWVISLASNQGKTDEPVTVEYEKSAEQKRYEQECVNVNTALQEDPDVEVKIKKDLIVSYCGCLGNSFFPNGSVKAVFPKRSTSYDESLKGEKDISDYDKTCRIKAFTEEEDTVWAEHGYIDSDYYGDLSHSFGDEEYIREYLTDYIRNSVLGYWNEYKYSVSIDIPCAVDKAYNKNTPPYYVETVFMNGTLRSAIQGCSNDPHIEDFLNY